MTRSREWHVQILISFPSGGTQALIPSPADQTHQRSEFAVRLAGPGEGVSFLSPHPLNPSRSRTPKVAKIVGRKEKTTSAGALGRENPAVGNRKNTPDAAQMERKDLPSYSSGQSSVPDSFSA
ncbi:hypothetical protein MLD38_021390 [Melastoma candidum]|uniref:Uncharacterized protein n=1 Tax=Melastoma candidum TaxID=119954 RepID=A0ACB9QJT4_9MYRT|nr:hypothetical protein MLD38_021390 [Melastoma candidum]